jgi:hypothetical protein
MDILQELLDKQGPTFLESEIARLSLKAVDDKFDDLLAQAFVERFVKMGDMKRLQSLLVVHCPEYVVLQPIEFFLAKSNQAEAMTQLIQASKNRPDNPSSRVLLRCLARAFPAIRKSEKMDKNFVDACEVWWAANKGKCSVNYDYPYLPSQPLSVKEMDLAKTGLFLSLK